MGLAPATFFRERLPACQLECFLDGGQRGVNVVFNPEPPISWVGLPERVSGFFVNGLVVAGFTDLDASGECSMLVEQHVLHLAGERVKYPELKAVVPHMFLILPKSFRYLLIKGHTSVV